MTATAKAAAMMAAVETWYVSAAPAVTGALSVEGPQVLHGVVIVDKPETLSAAVIAG